MKPSDTVTMAHVCNVLLGFWTDAINDMEGAGDPEFSKAEHAAECARLISRRFGINDMVRFNEASLAEGLIVEGF